MLDALCALDRVAPLNDGELSVWLSKYRYDSKVFVLPAWKEIYVNDAERDHTFAHAEVVHGITQEWYGRCGYRLIEVPRVSVAERCTYVLQWEAHTPAGTLAGTNRIEREYGGCVLHEHYTTGRGYSGESLNIYDSSRKVWHQTWVDTDGTLLLLEGGARDGAMVLEGQTANANAEPTKHRITWSTNADGSVRQLWESTDAKGQWSVAFDGKYTRK